MASVLRISIWLRTNVPKSIFIALTLIGIGFIWVGRNQGWSASFTVAVPVILMFAYFLSSTFLSGLRLHDEQAGDNLYYMGFLFTLTSLGESLYQFNLADPIDIIVQNFGVAVVTTICGIGLRIFYNQVRRDPIEIERVARHELAEMTRRVRLELEMTAREFASFRRVCNQMLEEGFQEIGEQAEKSGAHILKVMDSLTQEAVKPIRNASDQIKVVLDDAGVKAESRLTSALGRLESSTKNFEDANARLAHTLATFGSEVEEVRAKLTKVKTPDELITVRLAPTLSTLENLVTVHAKALASSDQVRADQTVQLQQTLQQTQLSVDRVVEVVGRTVLAMEKQLQESLASSQRIAESLERLVELSSSEKSRADQADRIQQSFQQTLQQTQSSVDRVAEVVRGRALAMEKQFVQFISSSQQNIGGLETLIKQQLADLRLYIERSSGDRSHMPPRGSVDKIPVLPNDEQVSSMPSSPAQERQAGSPRPVEPAAAKPSREASDQRRFRWWPRS